MSRIQIGTLLQRKEVKKRLNLLKKEKALTRTRSRRRNSTKVRYNVILVRSMTILQMTDGTRKKEERKFIKEMERPTYHIMIVNPMQCY